MRSSRKTTSANSAFTTLTPFGQAKLKFSLAQHIEFVHRLTQLKEKVFGGVAPVTGTLCSLSIRNPRFLNIASVMTCRCNYRGIAGFLRATLMVAPFIRPL